MLRSADVQHSGSLRIRSSLTKQWSEGLLHSQVRLAGDGVVLYTENNGGRCDACRTALVCFRLKSYITYMTDYTDEYYTNGEPQTINPTFTFQVIRRT